MSANSHDTVVELFQKVAFVCCLGEYPFHSMLTKNQFKRMINSQNDCHRLFSRQKYGTRVITAEILAGKMFLRSVRVLTVQKVRTSIQLRVPPLKCSKVISFLTHYLTGLSIFKTFLHTKMTIFIV